jgi:hypothetical protein
MKNVIFALLIISSLFIGGEAQAQRKIPSSVTEDLKAKFPEATEVEWSSKLSHFLAEFYVGKVPHEVRYTNKGEWSSTDELIEKEKTPADVLESLSKSKFSDWEILNIFKRTIPNGETQYRILIKKNNSLKRFLFYDPNGKYIKEQTVL